MLIKDIKTEIEELRIENDSQLFEANELAKKIKIGIKEVKAEYKEPKAEAKRVHTLVCNEEKERLKPWLDADKVVKTAIEKYMVAKRIEQKRYEEDQKELFGEVVESEQKVISGTHLRETWDVVITDESKVPVTWNNHVIRTIDISALKEIAKFTDGKADIEGVRFYKRQTVVIR